MSKDGVMTYSDRLSRWSGAGNRELGGKLPTAFKNQQGIKLVIAVAEGKEEENKVENGNDGSKIKKHFFVKPEALGKITKFDGENFVIEFCREE